MKIDELRPKDVEIIDIENSNWNCDKCIFFKEEICECMAAKRFLFAQVLRDDCNDCKRPFVLKSRNKI